MNEQIKQFAEQAKASVPAGLLVNEWIDKYNEIFAELIVKECADYFGREGDHRFEVNGNWIAKTIKQHFGVEE
ncbi:hypothetical protein UFOVP257_93 [uncultured Caudovirales phage]|uniref:Uncharacterized protein n=1 Tax=uncultured Caudovirales phage TaxID=2100421 RepID=A0A6J5LGB6_9CAUD|nr:hypothetical protein UFOVP257_93 [uncultured Caudovirales phage]